MAVGVVAVSWAAIFIRLCRLPAANVAAGRMALAVLLMAPFALRPTRRALKTLSRAETGLLLLAGAFLGLHFAAWVASLTYTSVASSVVLVTTNPLFVALGSRFLLKERLSRRVAAGICIASAGAVWVGWEDMGGPGGPGGLTGDLLALAGAVLFSGYLLIGRRLRTTLPTSAYAFPIYGVSAAVLLVLSAGQWEAWGRADARAWTFLLLLALVPTLIGHNCLNWALRHFPSPVVATAILGEPVLASVFAYLLLGERIGVGTATGGALVLAGVFTALSGPVRAPDRS
ncbi:MAG: DMT family transporter [Nitrospinota bacterium]